MSKGTMKAIGFKKSLPVSDPDSLIDIDLPKPEPSGKDLLVKIHAIAVNPVDYKVRLFFPPEEGIKVLGWDAVGEVESVGEDVKNFKAGDMVYYAGDFTRQGCNAEYQLIDERIVGKKPRNLSDVEAAALPLTTITAYEMLFEHLSLQKHEPGSGKKSDSDEVLLVVGAAGGVGSILLQLAKTLTNATIVATASRESSKEWVKKLGADYIVDHTKSIPDQIKELNIGPITHIASLSNTGNNIDSYVEILKPFGSLAFIDDPESLAAMKLKFKSISLHQPFMFTRSMFQTDDMQAQSNLLNEVSKLIEDGHVQTTVGKTMGKINAENLKKAHEELESGMAIGKLVLEGF